MTEETLEQRILAAENLYLAGRNMTDYWLMYNAVVKNKNTLKVELAEHTAKWLCNHPLYNINALINLFLIIHREPNEIEAVLRFLEPFIPPPIE